MTLPTYKVEIAFNAGVLTPAASRTWTDVTAYTLLEAGIEITYGRGDWRSTADANRLRLTLNNSTGRFTPGVGPTSPYYPNVKLGRPIRVTATLAGVTTTRFLGFIDEWPVEWPATVGTFTTSQVTASSRMAWLGSQVELKSIIENEILLDGPEAYYTLGESDGSTSAADSSGNSAASLVQVGTGTGVVFGNATGPGTDGLTAAQFASSGKRLQANLGAPGFAITLECFFSVPSAPAVSVFMIRADNAGALLEVFVTSAGLLTATADGGGTTSIVGPGVADGLTHHAALTVSSGGLYTLYLDGASVGNDTGPTVTTPGVVTVGINDASGITYVVAHAAVSMTALSSTRIAAHADAGLNGFAGETAAARLTRYASYVGIAATELSLETGEVPDLAHIDTTGRTALDNMRTVESTEEGVLFDSADGTLTFHDRAHRYGAASAFTLDVPSKHVAAGLTPRLDRAGIRNDVTATTSDGTSSAHVLDQSSIDDYGPARESLDLATSNGDEAKRHADWIVGNYAEPRPRIPQLGVINLASLTVVLTQAVLSAGVGTRFKVTGMPSQAAAASQEYYLEGYTESIGAGRHTITLNVAEAEPWNVWILGDPVYGVLGSTTRLAF